VLTEAARAAKKITKNIKQQLWWPATTITTTASGGEQPLQKQHIQHHTHRHTQLCYRNNKGFGLGKEQERRRRRRAEPGERGEHLT